MVSSGVGFCLVVWGGRAGCIPRLRWSPPCLARLCLNALLLQQACLRLYLQAGPCLAPAVSLERLLERAGNLHAPWLMWMPLPHQSGRRQGVCGASCNLLAIKDLGIGSGWQQSKQHWALPAVIGYSGRMGHGRLYSVKARNSKLLRSFDADANLMCDIQAFR